MLVLVAVVGGEKVLGDSGSIESGSFEPLDRGGPTRGSVLSTGAYATSSRESGALKDFRREDVVESTSAIRVRARGSVQLPPRGGLTEAEGFLHQYFLGGIREKS
ncbi:hypothetical protein NL676_031580 [Syzygium grande]|nr:hypothetical protein NL676_031580 [Syzygium grande]